MYRLGFVLICLCLVACKNKNASASDENGFSYDQFTKKFAVRPLPFVLADTSLSKTSDTTVIRSRTLSAFISDSIRNRLFGKTSKVKYIAMGKFSKPRAESYYVVKAINGNRRAALLLVFDKNEQFGAAFTLLNPNDQHIAQITTIDKACSITLSKGRKKANGTTAFVKDVYQYNPETKKFTLIMTDAQGEGLVDIINPIDSFPRKNRLSADYYRNKNSFVSIRDGRHPNQLMTFIHFENENGCTGEFKGELLLTSPYTAIYRHGGDPCVLSFTFEPHSVTLKEDQCGSHRGLDCLFEGSFQRRKEVKQKQKRKRI